MNDYVCDDSRCRPVSRGSFENLEVSNEIPTSALCSAAACASIDWIGRRAPAGHQAPGPVNLEVPSHGVSFRLPKGWLGFLSGDYFLVGAEAFDGFISMAAEKLTPKQALSDFRKTQALGDGFKMHPKGKPTAKRNVIQVDVEVSNGDQSNPGQLRAVIGKYSVGVVMGAVGVGQVFNRIQTVASAIEKPLISSKPAASSASPERIHGCWK